MTSSRQFPPRLPQQDRAVESRLGFAGSRAGRVRNAAPILQVDRVTAQVAAASQTVETSFWYEDHFTVSSTTPGTFTLTYLPRDDSEDITVNGVTLLPGTDWTRTGVTLTVDAGVWLGLTGSWDLLVQYEVAAAVAVPASTQPLLAYVAGQGSNNIPSDPLTIPQAVQPGDVGVLFTYWNFTPSGAFATWTSLYSSATMCVWMGTGVGTGTTIDASVGNEVFRAVAVFRNLTGTPTLVAAQDSGLISGFLTPVVTPAATAQVNDLVVTGVRGGCDNSSYYFPNDVWADTGFSGSYAPSHRNGGTTSAGMGISAGLASATSVDTSFNMTGTGTITHQGITIVLRQP